MVQWRKSESRTAATTAPELAPNCPLSWEATLSLEPEARLQPAESSLSLAYRSSFEDHFVFLIRIELSRVGNENKIVGDHGI
jgi:hypothetical protein